MYRLTTTWDEREGNERKYQITNHCYWAIWKSSIDDIEMVGGDDGPISIKYEGVQ